MNPIIHINKASRALISIKGIWRFAIGEQKQNGQFVYIYNGRMDVASEGTYRLLDSRISDRDANSEAIGLNMYHLTKSFPIRRKKYET